MLRKCAILGLAFVLVGGLAFAWVRKQTRIEQLEAATPTARYALQSDEYLAKYGRWYELTPEEQNQLVLELDKERQTKTPEELAAEQRSRLRLALPRLASGEMNPGDIADFLYGPNWQEQVTQYQKRKEQEQIAQTTAIVCFSIGGTLTGGCFVLWILWSIARAFKTLKRRRTVRRKTVDAEPNELTDIPHEELQESEPDAEDFSVDEGKASDRPEPAPPAGAPDSNTEQEGKEFERFIVPRSHRPTPTGRATLAMETRAEESPVAMLLSDEPAPDTEWSPEAEWSAPDSGGSSPETPPERQRFTPRPRVTVLGEEGHTFAETSHVVEESIAVAENPLQDQADDLQRQIAEFREMAQSVQQASREQSAPLSNTLKELAQQVSAIREYASSQQDRVEKLQDGYDWSIIRTFCLRVIRCIDNLENRMTKLAHGKGAAAHLEEVRDELLFALESSSIEQFRPEIHSDYRGQEKWAEAVKEKQSSTAPDEIGKIAKVVRPGYRYIIDEESYKIVRTAQVKLFG